jgi:SAM-dependent methyltransferase
MNDKKQNKNIDVKPGTPERFGYAWNIASKITKINEIQFLNWTKVIKNKKFWSGKKILDAGCGIGRNTYWPMSYGAKSAVSFDMDDRTLKAAASNLKKYQEASIEKLSIYDIPYKNEFDISFSIGVVHHLEFPEKAIDKLVQATKPGGNVLVWLYGYENMAIYVHVLNPIRKILFSKAPLPIVRFMSYIPTFLLYIYIHLGISKLEYFKLLKKLTFIQIQQIVFDQMLPKTAKYYKKNEALQLLNHKYLFDHKIEWVNQCSWSVMAKKK